MNMTCPTYLHQMDKCYDCYNGHADADKRLRKECQDDGSDGLHRFCDPEHDAQKCYLEMYRRCSGFLREGDTCYNCYNN